MKFGLMPAYQISPVETAEYAAGLARLAEEVGFESVWAAEHVVMPAEYASTYPEHKSGRMPIPDAAVPDPLTWLTWVGAASERLLLGTAVAILPQHNPLVFAKTVASLDRLSGGRVILGGENIARTPAHLRAQVLQGLHQHRGLDGHVDAAGDAGAVEGFLSCEFFAQGHQAGHFRFRDFSFLAAPIGQVNVGNLVIVHRWFALSVVCSFGLGRRPAGGLGEC